MMKLEVGSTVIKWGIYGYTFNQVIALPKKGIYTDDYVCCDHRIAGLKTGTPEQIEAFMVVHERLRQAQQQCTEAYNALEDAE